MALKHTYFFRPSRPTSPVPPPSPLPSMDGNGNATPLAAPVAERSSRPLSRLGLGMRRSSPAPDPSRVSTPSTLVQDGTYLNALSLKLSEAVTKALAPAAGPAAPAEQLNGRRPLPVGRGAQLGALIASELNAATGNPNLRRAITRALQRPMSVLLTNFSSLLLPLVASPAFAAPPALQPNTTQLHALAYASFAGELVVAFTDLGLGLESDMRGDGLRGVRDDLVSMVGRVITPLVGAVKADLTPLVEELEVPAPTVPTHSTTAAAAKGNKAAAGPHHPSLVALQALLPSHAKALVRYAAVPTAQTAVASLTISLVWRGLVALAHRPLPAPSPPPTPKMLQAALKKPRTLSSTTPPTTPPTSRFMIKLPPSRPPSPPGAPGAHARGSTPLTDAHQLLELLQTLPRPVGERQALVLAREAVDEAFAALRALVALLDAVAGQRLLGLAAEDARAALEPLTEDLPELVALPVLLRAFVFGDTGAGAPAGPFRGVADLLGAAEPAYRARYLAGFAPAEEHAVPVAAQVLARLRTLHGVMDAERPAAMAVVGWLEDVVEDDSSSEEEDEEGEEEEGEVPQQH